MVNFVNHLDPNGQTVMDWPQYHLSSPQLLTLLDGAVPFSITTDNYRAGGIDYLTGLSVAYPL